jgi:YggT family protein
MAVIRFLLWAYLIILLVRVLSSWLPVPPSGPLRTVLGWVYRLTEPVLRPLRQLIPPIRMGAVAFDLSAMIVFVAIGILLQVIR